VYQLAGESPVVVIARQKMALRRLLQQPRSSRSLAFRARIILECVSGQNNAAVADKLHTTGFTVGLWRNRVISEGLAGLGGEMRPGAPRQIGDDRVERAVCLTMEEAQGSHPLEQSRWPQGPA